MGGDRIDSWLYECWRLLSNSIEYIYYDQLGYYSDQPKDTTLWTNERFVEEASTHYTGLGSSNFFI
jgi:proline iminopeptidase